ncbi:hypothetical protein KIN20_034100 [Parelaphostrongylus tenuis]|uniref:Uncharacterized protein n=1 Tax=Parelaphostrongylus tenuis TaxID=148309 RepID=A0AAD5R957_PARTN|nr:hypothetical protein KIN20_034100 [Parelaphostrongylus tenuis]
MLYELSDFSTSAQVTSLQEIKINIFTNMSKVPINPFIISLLTTISIVLGCRVMPAGQASTRPFTVSGFSLPVAMVYAGTTEVATQVAGIATDKGAAQTFVQRLMMRTVFDVLERQARSALLPDL